MEEMKKRKTKTSSAVKNRYNAKVYGQVTIKIHKDTVAAFKAKCAEKGVSQASVLTAAIEAFLQAE